MTKLILLNGPAGVGKTTIARRYIQDNPLSLVIDGDEIMGMIGCWRQYEEEARLLKLKHISVLIESHLETGHDVVLPYLVIDSGHVDLFENMAQKYGADFYNVTLSVTKEKATEMLLRRGKWGEAGSKQLTEADMSRIHSLYDLFTKQLEKRPESNIVTVVDGDIEKTYNSFLEYLL